MSSYYSDLDEFLGIDEEVEELFREKENQEHETRKSRMQTQYKMNKEAETGTTINCACCGKIIIKKQYSQAFCSSIKKNGKKVSKCKDKYWNYTDDERNMRAMYWS